MSGEMKTVMEGHHLLMERSFQAPRDLVFQMFAESEHLENWWGPKGWETENAAFDFVPNGVWHYCMTCRDKSQGKFYGQASWGRAVYKEIQVPEKMVYIDQFSDENGNVAEDFPEMEITVNFVENGDTTTLRMNTQFASEEELKAVVNMGAIEGTTSQFERLDEYLASLDKAGS